MDVCFECAFLNRVWFVFIKINLFVFCWKVYFRAVSCCFVVGFCLCVVYHVMLVLCVCLMNVFFFCWMRYDYCCFVVLCLFFVNAVFTVVCLFLFLGVCFMWSVFVYNVWFVLFLLNYFDCLLLDGVCLCCFVWFVAACC